MNYDLKDIQNYVLQARRDLHKIPEVGTHLPQTKKYVISKLKELGLSYKENDEDSGLIVDIIGSEKGKTVAIRADMDALPMKEETDFDYKSTNENMHSCGHDAHTAILLGCAKILIQNKDKIKGTVRLIFQTAEEGTRGARIIVRHGAIENVSAIVGVHIGTMAPEVQSGLFVIQDGPLMASSNKLEITIKGKGTHAAYPEGGVDPITTAAIIIQALQNIKTRELPSTEPVVISICNIEAGNTYNIIPDTVNIKGTLRTFSKETKEFVEKRMKEVTEGIAKAMNAQASLTVLEGTNPVINNLEISKRLKDICESKFGISSVYKERVKPSMGGEDFSVYQEKVSGVFMFFSTSTEKNTPHHNSKFEIDDSKLYMPTSLMSEWAVDYLKNN